jgi:glycosyltransferase involved in cell wall biosynthesis
VTKVRGAFLGPMEVAGYFARLNAGLHAIGVRTLYADLEDHPFSYPEAPPPTLAVRLARVAIRRSGSAKRPTRRVAWRVASLLARSLLLARAIATCDLFIFGSGQTLFGRRELWLLRLLRKRIVIVFFGTDVRPSYLDGIEARSRNATPAKLVEWTRAKRDRIRKVERYAMAIVSHGPDSQLLSRDFVAWLSIGIPTPLRGAAQPRADGPLRILHAPSNPLAKGTQAIRDAIDALRREGLAIEYRELQGVSNEAVANAIAAADVIVDQLYSDTPMAVLASEAAAAGRPAVVGSLDWQAVLDDVPAESLPPTIRCEPGSIAETLRELARSPAMAIAAGHRARAFVRDRWSPEAVARRYLAIVEGTAPREWYRAPISVRYAGGTGLSEADLASVLAFLVEISDDPFAVGDKPELEARLRRVAASGHVAMSASE